MLMILLLILVATSLQITIIGYHLSSQKSRFFLSRFFSNPQDVKKNHEGEEVIDQDPYNFDLSRPINPLAYNYVAIDTSIIPVKNKDGTIPEPVKYEFKQPKSVSVPQEVNAILDNTNLDFENSDDAEKLFVNEAINKLEILQLGRKSSLRRPSLSSDLLEQLRKERQYRSTLLPPSVQNFVTAVYHEKILTPKAVERVAPTVYHEYRDWLTKTNAKKKEEGKYALAMAKNITAQDWLLLHPYSRSPVIERMVLSVPVGMRLSLKDYILEEDLSESAKKPSIPGAPFKSTNKLMSPSMINWDKSREELLTSVSSPSTSITLSENQHQESLDAMKQSQDNDRIVFRIDDVDMYVANNPSDEYFVVL